MNVYEVAFMTDDQFSAEKGLQRVLVRARNEREAVLHSLNEISSLTSFQRVSVSWIENGTLIDSVYSADE